MTKVILMWNKFSNKVDEVVTSALLKLLYALVDRLEQFRRDRGHTIVRIRAQNLETTDHYNWHVR